MEKCERVLALVPAGEDALAMEPCLDYRQHHTLVIYRKEMFISPLYFVMGKAKIANFWEI